MATKKPKQQPEEGARSRGIFILALGHPFYGRMAFNLAVSLKESDPEVKIAVGFAGDSLRDLFRYDIYKYFDRIIPVEDKYFTRRGHQEFLRAKLCILDLSPWDDTLFLDADTIWLHGGRTPSELMDDLHDVPLAVQNRGAQDLKKKLENGLLLWSSASHIRDAYGLKSGKLFSLYSECMWIKRTVQNILLFETAQQINDDLLVDYKEFAGGVPDELPLSIAMALTSTYPHQQNWIPVYWEHLEKKRLYEDSESINNQHYAFSCGGKVTPPAVKEFYNMLASVAFQNAKLQYPYFIINKKDFLPERKKI